MPITREKLAEEIRQTFSGQGYRMTKEDSKYYATRIMSRQEQFDSFLILDAIQAVTDNFDGYGRPKATDIIDWCKKKQAQKEQEKGSGNGVAAIKKQYLYDALIWLDTFNLYIIHYLCRLKQGPVDDFRLIYSAVKSVLEAEKPQISAMTQVAEEVKRFGVEFEKSIDPGPEDRKAWYNEYCGYFYNGKKASKEVQEVCDSMRPFFMVVEKEIMEMEGRER